MSPLRHARGIASHPRKRNDPMPEPISTAAFRQSLARFASGVTIVTARSPDGPAGFTATAFSSVSLDPPLVLICVGKAASAYEAVFGADHVGVSILAENQAWVAEQFARPAAQRFEGVALYEEAIHPVPLIDGALVQLVGKPHARIDAGAHTILILHIERTA